MLEATLETLLPPPTAIIFGIIACIAQNMLRTFKLKAKSHCSSVASQIVP
jgi:hypothetical protein